MGLLSFTDKTKDFIPEQLFTIWKNKLETRELIQLC